MERLSDMTEGSAITMEEGRLSVPDQPIIHYIEGDGIGVDITPVMIDVVDAAVNKAYSGSRRIHWSEVSQPDLSVVLRLKLESIESYATVLI